MLRSLRWSRMTIRMYVLRLMIAGPRFLSHWETRKIFCDRRSLRACRWWGSRFALVRWGEISRLRALLRFCSRRFISCGKGNLCSGGVQPDGMYMRGLKVGSAGVVVPGGCTKKVFSLRPCSSLGRILSE